MKILREVDQIRLNEGNLQARGLYNLYNEATDEVSYWFEDETAEKLLCMSDAEFVAEAKTMIKLTI